MQVIIHVGPGKTGSSAIQKWLSDNRFTLKRRGIYYPEHQLDSNGVSSGNSQTLFSYDASKKLVFSKRKASEMLAKAKNGGYSKILLSSEAFIARFEPIADFFPSAEYVFYLRNPIESAESLYNQSVKRHFNTQAIRAPKNLNYKRLARLYELSGGRVHLRKYGKQYFKNGDIVADFLSVVAPEVVPDKPASIVNLSYAHEALELKRRLNFFPAVAFHSKLDKYLQQYEGNITKYSLLPPKEYDEVKSITIERLEALSEEIGEDLYTFINQIKESPQRCYQAQELYIDEVSVLFDDMRIKEPSLFNQICMLVQLDLLPSMASTPIRKAIGEQLLKTVKFSFSWATKFKRILTPVMQTIPLEGMNEFLESIRIKDASVRADLLRDMSDMYIKNKYTLSAFRCMAEAKVYRPHGEYINTSLSVQANKIYRTFK